MSLIREMVLALVLMLVATACATPGSRPAGDRPEMDSGSGPPCSLEADVGVEFETDETDEGTTFRIRLVSDDPGCLARTRGWIEIEPEPTEGLVRVGLPFFAAWNAPTGLRGDEAQTDMVIATWTLVNWCYEPISLVAARFERMASAVFDSQCEDPSQPAVLTRLEDKAD